MSEIQAVEKEINDIINYPPDYDSDEIDFLIRYKESLERLLMKNLTFIQELKFLNESGLPFNDWILIIAKMLKKRILE